MSTEQDAMEKQVAEELFPAQMAADPAGFLYELTGAKYGCFDADHRALLGALVAARLKLAGVEREREIYKTTALYRGKTLSDIAEKAVARHNKRSLQPLNVESYAELIDDAACREFARGLIERAESASLKLAAADRLAEEDSQLITAAAEYVTDPSTKHRDHLLAVLTRNDSALLEYQNTKV